MAIETQSTLSPRPALDAAALRAACGQPGPCLTFVIPDHRPAASDGNRARALKDLIRDAEQILAKATRQPEAPGLLKPVTDYLQANDLESGGPGLVIYRSENFFGAYESPGRTAPQVTLASHPIVAPFLEHAMSPGTFFVLGLSQKHLRLLECTHGVCAEHALPDEIPASPTEAFDTPQRGLNRSAPTGGEASGVAFGTATEKEKSAKHLHDYFKTVDRILTPILAGRPLLLAGIRTEIAAYRDAANYPSLLSTEIDGNIDHRSSADLSGEATEAARRDWLRHGEAVLQHLQDPHQSHRTLTDPAAIVEAAAAGRIHQLCVRAQTTVPGRLPIPLNVAHSGEEDLLNAACAATLANGGDVFAVAPDFMDETQPTIALLRY